MMRHHTVRAAGYILLTFSLMAGVLLLSGCTPTYGTDPETGQQVIVKPAVADVVVSTVDKVAKDPQVQAVVRTIPWGEQGLNLLLGALYIYAEIRRRKLSAELRGVLRELPPK